jgi:hypothetical protein
MTILGLHTIPETNDLIKLVQYRFDQVHKGYLAIPQSWRDTNPVEFANIQANWNVEIERWRKVREDVLSRLWKLNWSNPGSPASIIASENEYQEVLQFVEYGGKVGGQIVNRRPNDLRDMQMQIERALGRSIDLQSRPSFTSEDVDHQGFLKLDAAIKAGEQGAGQAGKKVLEGGKEVSKSLASSPTFWAVMTVAAIGGIVYLKKG